ncbi:MAG: DeoR/GlpR transcriptional regulator [Clostridia bacterium]|nr:DeoR/GlpR transcriptional regulator [Clostridia bacterium]
MLTNARQKLIEKIALRDGEVIISRVAKELDVSIETIRRDINSMCEQNILEKVHGGAIPVKATLSEASYSQRKSSNSAIKNKIGKAAAKLIKSGQVVAFSTGSTVEAVAANITGVHNLTALTNSLPVGNILSDLKESDSFDGKTVLFGGDLHPTEHLTFGADTCRQVRNYFADISFVGVAALSPDGLMSTGTDEGCVSAEMVKCSNHVVVVAESRKLGKRSIFRFAKLEEIHTLVTDSKFPLSDEMKFALSENNIEIIVVE